MNIENVYAAGFSLSEDTSNKGHFQVYNPAGSGVLAQIRFFEVSAWKDAWWTVRRWDQPLADPYLGICPAAFVNGPGVIKVYSETRYTPAGGIHDDYYRRGYEPVRREGDPYAQIPPGKGIVWCCHTPSKVVITVDWEEVPIPPT